ncbi:MAG: hypothetical protein HKN24_00155 [Acidimicrobiales bacterium]|nr:hypothetical protein [Acidimicrobiales bacterium]
MTRCRGCGEDPGVGNYCTNCGLPLGEATSDPELIGAPATNRAPAPGRRIRRWWVVGFAVVLGGVGLAAGLSLVDSAPSDDEAGLDDSLRVPNRINADEALGWYVVATDQDGLIRVDPASGEVVDLDIPTRLLGRAWGSVVVQDIEGRVYALDPASLAGETPIEVPGPINDELYAFLPSWITTSSTPDHVWLVRSTGGAVEVNLRTGAEGRRAEVEARALSDLSTTPGFVSPPSGGVYRLEEAGDYVRVADGAVMTEAPGAVLVQRCSTELECSNLWLDATDLTAVTGRFTPTFRRESMRVAAVADGEYLATEFTDRVGGSEGSEIRLDYSEVRHIETGRRVELHSVELQPLWLGRGDIAPDGSLVAVARRDELYVRATTSRIAVRMETGSLLTGTTPVFIAKPNPVG